MYSRTEITNPLEVSNWNQSVANSPNGSFFHTYNWAQVLSESYGYSPQYFCVKNKDSFEFLLPCMSVNSILTGKRGISLPFTDFCNPIVSNGFDIHNLIETISQTKLCDWKSIEIRGGNAYFKNTLPAMNYYGHDLDLIAGESDLFARLNSATRRNIRKATKQGVNVLRDNSISALEIFYALNCRTRKKHGLPPQPLQFFRNVHAYIIKRNMGDIFIGTIQKRPIAASIYFHFGSEVLYKYGASDNAYQHFRANNLVMWEAIKYYANKSFVKFDFGKTALQNEGLRHYKSGWGTTEYVLSYYKFDFNRRNYVQENGKENGWHTHVFNLMPVPFLKAVGSILYKHVA